MSARLQMVRARLEAACQAHLLTFYDELTAAQQHHLLNQIASLNFDLLNDLIERYVKVRPRVELPSDLEPAPYYRFAGHDSIEGSGKPFDVARVREVGEQLIRAGKVAAFTVAGGQGTRLGWNGPKGTYPATAVTGKPLFRVFAEQILATQRRCNVLIPWYIMTSPANDAETRAFFADNNYFNLPRPRQNIFFFPQGMLPSIDAASAKLLLAEKHELAMNPDGHGGSIKALRESGAIDDMLNRGIEHISYFQVDNPIVRCIDPIFIGLHASAPDSSAQMSSKMVIKSHPEEKVGVFCRSAGKTMVIEYSDLPKELAQQRDHQGKLRFDAGSIAIHILGTKFVEQLTAVGKRFALPFHRADKKVSFIDTATGKRVQPEKPNAVKLEAFVFDAIPLAESSIIYQTSRVEEFAPIKNASGEDSPATSHQIQSNRHGRWLERCGVQVPRNSDGQVQAEIEISPLTALEPDELCRQPLPRKILPEQQIVL